MWFATPAGFTNTQSNIHDIVLSTITVLYNEADSMISIEPVYTEEQSLGAVGSLAY